MMNKKAIVRVVFAIWIFIWLLFLIRPYFKKGLLKEYSTLLGSSLEEKRAFVTGKELYEFIKFCKDSIVPPSSYKIIGLEEEPLSYRRAAYYLYPDIDSPEPEFLLIYKKAGFAEKGYSIFKNLDSEKYILKKGK